ncbi:MAG: ribonuclease Y [Coriobacteriales bacterium]|jgi:ribonuclease Y|nr:ribonuclease Y [Coriobacteriales bacterium]
MKGGPKVEVGFVVLFVVVALIVGGALGFVVARFVISSNAKSAIANAERTLKDAEKQAETLRREALVEAKDAAYQIKTEADKEASERRKEIKSLENRLLQREENLDKRVATLDTREHQLSSMGGQLERRQKDLEAAIASVQGDLERIAHMTTDDARKELLDAVRGDVTREAAAIIRDSEQQARTEADKKSREIISLAIQRVAADHAAEHTVSSVSIPSDDIKGRIIGREGRNIRTFEQITGINLIIDDTPEVVVISSFDPVRREIGRITLESLIADGRIHPARIEETFNKATDNVMQQVQEAGDQAAFDAGIHDLHPELIKTLGRLKFRTSYGQNVLNHSLEVAYLAGVMASELGLDPAPAKRAGLLHDLGKAIDHEIEGSHAVIGADLARRFGESADIVHAIEAHHNDTEPSTVLAVLVQAADAISAARPGARRETIESYIKRLEKLESIANGHKGVEKTYAMQAGREVRVMVEPEAISDSEAVVLAHDIAKQIEDEMEYPGQIKVLVIRESRSVDYAK